MPKNALPELFLTGSWILDVYLVNIAASNINLYSGYENMCVSVCVYELIINYISINEMIKQCIFCMFHL